jgi:hypothetical protein
MQLSKIVHMFSRNIYDASLPATIQTTSIRLLLNLTDFIFHNKVTTLEPSTATAAPPSNIAVDR